MIGFGASAEGAGCSGSHVDGRPRHGATFSDKSWQQLQPTEEPGFLKFLPHQRRRRFCDMSVVPSCSGSAVGAMVAGSRMGPSWGIRPLTHRHSRLCACTCAGHVANAGAGLMESSLGRWGGPCPIRKWRCQPMPSHANMDLELPDPRVRGFMVFREIP